MPEVSVVLPCLNEEKTTGICIEKAKKVFEEHRIDGEVIKQKQELFMNQREVTDMLKITANPVLSAGSISFLGNNASVNANPGMNSTRIVPSIVCSIFI